MDCPACIKLLASSDGKALEIKSLCLEHENHALSQPATYSFLAQGFTLMLNLVEDSHGLSEVVGACLMVNEDRATFKWFLEHFKNENLDGCKRINCFMADKDLLERDVLSEVFGVPVYICLFHTLKTFSRQITTEKMKISAQQREEILRLLQDLAYISSEWVYDEKYATLSDVAPKRVLEYFNKNWHPIRNEWTVYSMVHGNLKNITNNRLESINNKIKQVVPKNSTLVLFIEYFFEWLNSHKFERNHKAAQHVLKRPVTVYGNDSAESQYLTYLTGHAYRYVLNEIQKSSFISADAIAKDDVTGEYSVRSKGAIVLVTSASCQCGDWTSMMLPCQHIFAVRRLEQLALFDEDLCDTRWTRDYYLENQRTFRSRDNAQPSRGNTPTPVVVTTKKQRSLTLTEKRKRALSVTSSLVTLVSLASRDLFLYKMNALKTIEQFWREGYEVSIERIDMSSSRSTSVSLFSASETSDCEEDCTSEACFHVNNQGDQTTEGNVRNGCGSRASNCGSVSAKSIVEAIPGSSKECLLSETPESDINTGFLPIIEEEDFGDLGSSFTENDSVLLAKILDVDQPFNLLDFMGATTSSRSESPTKPVATIQGSISRERITQFDNAESGSVTDVIQQMANNAFAVTDDATTSKTIDVPHNYLQSNDVERTSTTENVFDDNPESRQVLKEIVMPASVRVRGRPRGAGLTVIGTKAKKQTVQKKGPIAYKQRSDKEKVRLVLGWCVSEHIIPDVLCGKFLVQECDVEMRPEKIDSAILDENVDLHILQNYVNDEALDAIISTIEIKRKTAVWLCSVCTENTKKSVP